MKLLLTGGAGYIGSIVARRLRDEGHAVVVLDDLSTGHRAAATGSDLVVGDFGNRSLVLEVVRRRGTEAVVHLAASALVGESVANPALYYRNNLERSLTLLDALREADVARFVFSSSAAVYGEPVVVPMAEDHPTRPTNPYGETKLAFEKALSWYHAAHGVRSVSLRYFNAAGATQDGALGEVHTPETHLVPNVLRAALGGPPVPIYGTDYATHDGTAVRDYIHVEDLADAHLLALGCVERRGGALVCNLGNGAG
ncbi:MAG: UDP-glucose 4-epimerase GalE, partial [Candidatus Polarisedimenticolia bacterium]